jgi:hypothetical protein
MICNCLPRSSNSHAVGQHDHSCADSTYFESIARKILLVEYTNCVASSRGHTLFHSQALEEHFSTNLAKGKDCDSESGLSSVYQPVACCKPVW